MDITSQSIIRKKCLESQRLPGEVSAPHTGVLRKRSSQGPVKVKPVQSELAQILKELAEERASRRCSLRSLEAQVARLTRAVMLLTGESEAERIQRETALRKVVAFFEE